MNRLWRQCFARVKRDSRYVVLSVKPSQVEKAPTTNIRNCACFVLLPGWSRELIMSRSISPQNGPMILMILVMLDGDGNAVL